MLSDTVPGFARLAALASMLLGCPAAAFRCDLTRACNAGSVCAADGFCAEAVSASVCPSGLRYSPSAARPGACVSEGDAKVTDAPGEDTPGEMDSAHDLGATDITLTEFTSTDLTVTEPTLFDLAFDPRVTDAATELSPFDVSSELPSEDLGGMDGASCGSPPRLIAPLAGTRLGGTRVELRVHRGASAAELQFSSDGLFRDAAIISLAAGSPLVGAPINAPGRGLFYWHARTRCAGSSGPWGPRWTFFSSGREGVASPIGWIPDLNGDGLGDLVIANPRSEASELRTPSVEVLFGRLSSEPSRSLGNFTGITAPTPDLRGFGGQVAVVADMNGDGLSELAVSACQRSPSVFCAPQVIVYAGTRGGSFSVMATLAVSAAEGRRFGTTLAGVGDLDGDGYGDLAIGDPGDFERGFGSVYVAFGGASAPRLAGPLERVATMPDGGVPMNLFGWRVVGPGDVTGDGVADLIITSFQSAWVLPGGPSMTELRGGLLSVNRTATAEGVHGFQASAAGDINGDGVADFALGRVGGPSLIGDVAIFAGSASSSTRWMAPLAVVQGSFMGDNFGRSLAGDGDVNGDGMDDLLIGAPDSSEGGSAYLVLGGGDGRGLSITRMGSVPGGFGRSAAFMGDFDGDGNDEIALGAGLSRPDLGTVFTFRGPALTGARVRPWVTITDGTNFEYGTWLSGR